jgi:hypothetical protein
MPIGIAYAFWSGTGITLTVIAENMIWHEALDWTGERLRCSRSSAAFILHAQLATWVKLFFYKTI